VIYGATGYTGCLMVEHLDALLMDRGAQKLKWALAGRNKEKLQALAAKCDSEPGVLEATTDEQLEVVADLCHVVVSAAGPFHLCGHPLVRACVEKRTHYIDVTGEVVWMRSVIDRYHAAAKEKGVMIVQCCGAMSAHNDISCYLLAKRLGPMAQYREYNFGGGTQSGGTFLTGYKQYDGMLPSDFERVHLNPFALGGRPPCGPREEDADPTEAARDPLFPSVWQFPGHATHPTSRVLRRSAGLFAESPEGGPDYGKEVVIVTRCSTLDEKTAQRTTKSSQGPQDVRELVKYSMLMETMTSTAPPPGCGAPQKARAMCHMESFAVAQGAGGEWAHVHFTGPEGYEATALAAITGALVMVQESELIKPKERGGVITPAFAFHGSSWIDRLGQRSFANTRGRPMSFEVLDGKPSEEAVQAALLASDVANGQFFEAQRKGVVSAWKPPELYER